MNQKKSLNLCHCQFRCSQPVPRCELYRTRDSSGIRDILLSLGGGASGEASTCYHMLEVCSQRSGPVPLGPLHNVNTVCGVWLTSQPRFPNPVSLEFSHPLLSGLASHSRDHTRGFLSLRRKEPGLRRQLSHKPWVVILGQMCRGVSSIPGQTQSWGCAPRLPGLSCLLDSILPLRHTQTGICSSVKTHELPSTPGFPGTPLRAAAAGSQGFQRSPPLGGLEQQISLTG